MKTRVVKYYHQGTFYRVDVLIPADKEYMEVKFPNHGFWSWKKTTPSLKEAKRVARLLSETPSANVDEVVAEFGTSYLTEAPP